MASPGIATRMYAQCINSFNYASVSGAVRPYMRQYTVLPQKEWHHEGIVKLTQKTARLCSKGRTMVDFGLSRALVFSLFSSLSFPQGEGV